MKICLFLYLILLFQVQYAFAQSDDCRNAELLEVFTECITIPSGTFSLNDFSTENSCNGNTDDDGWFKFFAISELTQITVSSDQLADMAISLFKDCNTELACVNDKDMGGQEFLFYETIPGEEYLVQVYHFPEGSGGFLICITAKDLIGPEDSLVCPIITTDFEISPNNCPTNNTGSIQINSTDGGVEPYLFQLNGGSFRSTTLFQGLETGFYTLSIRDDNGCQMDTLIELSATSFPTIDIGADLTITQGEIVNIQVVSNLSAEQTQSISWSNIFDDSCLQPCYTNTFPALKTEIISATLTTIDNCLITDEIQLTILPKLEVYIPSVFSPNGDGINDTFTIFAGAGVAKISTLKIYDRWGNLVFQKDDFLPNTLSIGWNGTFREKAMESGVFIYQAELELIGEVPIQKVGEIFLLR